MRYAPLIIIALALGGCGDSGEYAVHVCVERDIVSGTCTKGKWICTEPLTLRSDLHARPRCYMPGEQP